MGKGEGEGKNQGRMALMSSELYSKEVQAEQEPTRKHVEMESVTHHDYQKELVKEGPPASTKVRIHPTPHIQLDSGEL